MSLKLFLEKLSHNLQAETTLIRNSFKNTTNQGSGFETVLRNLISAYIPSTNIVTHGEIIDTFGNQSGQVDIAIAHESHPKGYKDGRPNLLFYDLIIAIGEAKVLLNTEQLGLALKSAKAIGNFKRHSENNNMLSGEFYGSTDTLQKAPPYFLIALSCNVSLNTIISKIAKSNISLVIVLEHNTSKNGYIVLGETHRNAETIATLNTFGNKKEDYLWETNNPVLGLIWALNNFGVPYIGLTNMTCLYLA